MAVKKNNRNTLPGRPRKWSPHLNVKRLQRDKVNGGEAERQNDNSMTHLIVTPDREQVNLTPTTPKESNKSFRIGEVSIVDNSPCLERNKNETQPPTQPLLCKEINALELHKRRKRKKVCKKSGNRLVDLDSLVEMITETTVCRSCGCDMKVSEETIGIATSIVLECCNNTCNINKKTVNHRTYFSDNKINYRSMESYAANVFLVLGLQQIGAGASDSGILISYLNLPSASLFQAKSFNQIESAVRPTIKKLTQQSINEALIEEIKETIQQEKPPRAKRKLLEHLEQKEIDKKEIPLTVSYDMGWNKRSSGTRYDSISGHGLMIGGYSKKVIGFKCVSKD